MIYVPKIRMLSKHSIQGIRGFVKKTGGKKFKRDIKYYLRSFFPKSLSKNFFRPVLGFSGALGRLSLTVSVRICAEGSFFWKSLRAKRPGVMRILRALVSPTLLWWGWEGQGRQLIPISLTMGKRWLALIPIPKCWRSSGRKSGARRTCECGRA